MILSFINIHKVPQEMLSPRFSTPPSGPCECLIPKIGTALANQKSTELAEEFRIFNLLFKDFLVG